MMEMGCEALLETIRKAGGMDFLSDLHSNRYRTAVRESAQAIPDEDYSLSDWQKAAEYILGAPLSGRTIPEVRNELLENLMKP